MSSSLVMSLEKLIKREMFKSRGLYFMPVIWEHTLKIEREKPHSSFNSELLECYSLKSIETVLQQLRFFFCAAVNIIVCTR